VIEIGTSWIDSARFVAVTVISSTPANVSTSASSSPGPGPAVVSYSIASVSTPSSLVSSGSASLAPGSASCARAGAPSPGASEVVATRATSTKRRTRKDIDHSWPGRWTPESKGRSTASPQLSRGLPLASIRSTSFSPSAPETCARDGHESKTKRLERAVDMASTVIPISTRSAGHRLAERRSTGSDTTREPADMATYKSSRPFGMEPIFPTRRPAQRSVRGASPAVSRCIVIFKFSATSLPCASAPPRHCPARRSCPCKGPKSICIVHHCAVQNRITHFISR
jgi:hypothetical protein